MKIGKKMRALLEFANHNRGWQSFNTKDKPTVSALMKLEEGGKLQVSYTTAQFRHPVTDGKGGYMQGGKEIPDKYPMGYMQGRGAA